MFGYIIFFEVVFQLKKIEVFFLLTKIEVVFHFQIILLLIVFGYIICFRSSSIFKKIEVVVLFLKWRSSSIFKNIEVVFHISSGWVGIRLHTKNQVPRLHGSCLNCNDLRCGGVVFLTDNNTIPTKLFYIVLLVGLWQLGHEIIKLLLF